MSKIYCLPRGCVCGNTECGKNFCHSPRGCAVSTEDFSDKCDSFRKRYIIQAKSVDEAMDKINEVAALEGVALPNYALKTKIEIRGLTVYDIEHVISKMKG